VGVTVSVIVGVAVNVAHAPLPQAAPDTELHDPHPAPESMKQAPPQSQHDTAVAVLVAVATAVGVTVGVTVTQLKSQTALGTGVQALPHSEPVA